MIRKAAVYALLVTMIFGVVSCSKDSTGPDWEDPKIQLLTPWDDTFRSGKVPVKVRASDVQGIERVEIFVDGELYDTKTSAPFVFEWDMDNLVDENQYEIYARITNIKGRTAVSGTARVTKRFIAPPVGTISGPADGFIIEQGDLVQFSGSGIDADGVAIPAQRISWSSNIQGNLGTFGTPTGSPLNTSGLVIGTHTVTLTVTDPNGQADEKTVTVQVNDNNRKYATIESGTYGILDPPYQRQEVTLSRPYHVWKTEFTVGELAEAFASASSPANPDSIWRALFYDTRAAWRRTSFDDFNPDFPENYFTYTTPMTPDGSSTKYTDYPVAFMSVTEAMLACNILSIRDGLDPAYTLDPGRQGQFQTDASIIVDYQANGWRLPTEAEWEVAARGGREGYRYPWGNTLPTEQANSLSDAGQRDYYVYRMGRGPVPVRTYAPNPYGLYDMAGNVAEMCIDQHSPVLPHGVDFVGVSARTRKRYVVKGGGWYQYGAQMEIGLRQMSLSLFDHGSQRTRDFYDSGVGFRPVRYAD